MQRQDGQGFGDVQPGGVDLPRLGLLFLSEMLFVFHMVQAPGVMLIVTRPFLARLGRVTARMPPL